MKQHIGSVSLPVGDYDEAIDFYTQKLGFRLVQDRRMSNGKRWVQVTPPGASETSLLLSQCKGAQCKGSQYAASQPSSRTSESATGEAVNKWGLLLYTDDFWRDYREMRTHGVQFEEEPREEAYATVAGFEDPYGNHWDLMEIRR